jgi:hypothetical protein
MIAEPTQMVGWLSVTLDGDEKMKYVKGMV